MLIIQFISIFTCMVSVCVCVWLSRFMHVCVLLLHINVCAMQWSPVVEVQSLSPDLATCYAEEESLAEV